jgi:hypothetical protein
VQITVTCKQVELRPNHHGYMWLYPDDTPSEDRKLVMDNMEYLNHAALWVFSRAFS